MYCCIVCDPDMYRLVDPREILDQPRRYHQSWRTRRRASLGRQEHVDVLRRLDLLYVFPSSCQIFTNPSSQTRSNSSYTPRSSIQSSSCPASSRSTTSSHSTSPSERSPPNASTSSSIAAQHGTWTRDTRTQHRRRSMGSEGEAVSFVGRIWSRENRERQARRGR